MSKDYYEDRPFKISVSEGSTDSGISPNGFDGGKTETAWVDIVDDETESIRARVQVQVHRQPIPHTESEERTFKEDDVLLDPLDVDTGESLSARTEEQLLDDTDAVKHLRSICSRRDIEDRLSEEE